MLTFELPSNVLEITNDAYTTLSQNLIGCSTPSQNLIGCLTVTASWLVIIVK